MEAKRHEPWWWTQDDRDTNYATLTALKKELGLPIDTEIGAELKGMNIREAVEEAVAKHAEPARQPGYIKSLDKEYDHMKLNF
jgi:hypothetical protein